MKDIRNLMDEQKKNTSYYPISQGDIGDYLPKVPAIKMTQMNQRFISLGRSDFGDDSPKVPAHLD